MGGNQSEPAEPPRQRIEIIREPGYNEDKDDGMNIRDRGFLVAPEKGDVKNADICSRSAVNLHQAIIQRLMGDGEWSKNITNLEYRPRPLRKDDPPSVRNLRPMVYSYKSMREGRPVAMDAKELKDCLPPGLDHPPFVFEILGFPEEGQPIHPWAFDDAWRSMKETTHIPIFFRRVPGYPDYVVRVCMSEAMFRHVRRTTIDGWAHKMYAGVNVAAVELETDKIIQNIKKPQFVEPEHPDDMEGFIGILYMLPSTDYAEILESPP